MARPACFINDVVSVALARAECEAPVDRAKAIYMTAGKGREAVFKVGLTEQALATRYSPKHCCTPVI